MTFIQRLNPSKEPITRITLTTGIAGGYVLLDLDCSEHGIIRAHDVEQVGHAGRIVSAESLEVVALAILEVLKEN
jgi:hypothetical protein